MNEPDGLVKDRRVDPSGQPGTAITPGRPAPASLLAAGAASLLAVGGLAWAAGAADWLTHPGFRAWQTVCVAITVQVLELSPLAVGRGIARTTEPMGEFQCRVSR